MADNTTLPGTGESIASDDIGGVKYQRVKISVGAHAGAGANTDYRLGPVAVWRRLLTAAEKARWLNWGTGAPYAGLR